MHIKDKKYNKMNKNIQSKKQKYNAALAMAVLMTLGGFTFGTNPTFAETNDKPVWVGSYNAGAYKDGIFVSNADTTDNLVHIGADVQTKVVNVTDSVTSNNKAVYVGVYDKLVANEGVNISNINFHDTTSTGEKHGLYVFGATVEAPTIRVDNLTTDSTEALAGLVAGTDVGYGMNKETLKADSIYVGNVKSDTSKYVYGSLLQGALWQSFHEGQDNNFTIENITGGADNAIVGGIEVQFANSTMSDCSYDITGDTVISNINSTQGSAYGIMAKGSSTGSEAAYMHLNNLKISDIHGKDLSVGICGHVGDIIVDNADINMTGKDGYNGLYAEPVADAEKAAVNSFAISGSLVGNIKLDNAEGSYNIQGDILADRFNLDKQVEVAIKQLEDPKTLEQLKEQLKEGHPDWTDEQVDDFVNNQVADLVNTLKNSGHINLGGKLALYGDVYAKCGGNVNINLTKDSIFEGQADNYADCDTFCSIVWRKADLDGLNKSALYKLFGFDSMQEQLEMQGLPIVGAGKIDISMKDDSIWKAHGKSFVDTLNFKDGGLVDMHAEDGSSITAGKVTGNGTFIMNLSNNADKSDMLYVKDFSEAGVQTIQANLKDSLKPEDLKGMRFATTGGDD